MDEREVVAALVEQGFDAPSEVSRTGDGWANWTFLVDGHLIARFPRNAEVARATERELALLPALGDRVTFQVPKPLIIGTWDGFPWFAYRRIPGRPLAPGDRAAKVVAKLAAMLDQLHGFPLDDAGRLLGSPHPEGAWRARYEDVWESVEEVALPELDRELAGLVVHRFEAMLEDTPEFPQCLIHNDLGPEHVMMDNHGMPVGVIDFEDAAIGDPATDLVPIVATLGSTVLPGLVGDRDLGERLGDRMAFYRWMASVHAIIYGVTEDVPAERDAGVAELGRRLGIR